MSAHYYVAATYNNLGQVIHYIVDVNYSFKHYCEFLRITHNNKMWRYPDVAKTLHKISDVSQEKKDNFILNILKDTLHIEPKCCGVESAQFVATLNKLGISYVEVDDYQSTETSHEQELWIQIKSNELCKSNHFSACINIDNVCEHLHT